MWDYDKLFAEGNIIGVNIKCKNVFNISSVDNENVYEWKLYYANDELKYQDNEHRDYESYIQYIIRLDEHGNVVEKLFDRDTDMPKPMPELETGMFVVVRHGESKQLGYVDVEHNKIIYQSGGWDEIDGEYGVTSCSCVEILSIYGKKAICFDGCRAGNIIWRKPESN